MIAFRFNAGLSALKTQNRLVSDWPGDSANKKRPEAFRFEPLNQTRYYYGRKWGLSVRELNEQVGGVPTAASV